MQQASRPTQRSAVLRQSQRAPAPGLLPIIVTIPQFKLHQYSTESAFEGKESRLGKQASQA